MWSSFVPRGAAKRAADVLIPEESFPKRVRFCTKFTLAEQALVNVGMPVSVADIVKRFAVQPQFAAFDAKYGSVAPATYIGEIFVSDWHPRIACTKWRRFGWSCEDLRYFVDKEVIIEYRPIKSAFGKSVYIKTLVDVFRDRVVVGDRCSQFSLQRDRLIRVTAFVNVLLPNSGGAGRTSVLSCYSDH